MACAKVLCFMADKLVKTIFILLLIIMMILWIVLAVEAGRQITEINHRTIGNNGNIRIKPEDARRLPGTFASAAMISVTKGSINRLYGLTVFNTILEEFIAFGSLISLVLRARRTFNITITLLTIIWFIEQYRISDFYHQIDHIDYQNGQIMIATHVIHFLIIIIGIFFAASNNLAHDTRMINRRTEQIPSSSTSITTTTTASPTNYNNKTKNNSSLNSFIDLEHGPDHGDHDTIFTVTNKSETTQTAIDNSENNGKRNRCAWMRKTFIKSTGDNNHDKSGTKQQKRRKQHKSLVKVIGVERSFDDHPQPNNEIQEIKHKIPVVVDDSDNVEY
ncbi:hypothetical protein BLOT_013724 [Blomia tropicalis]|nr:hypothetical protein BLOT_013724 [Blomia tropicalis]